MRFNGRKIFFCFFISCLILPQLVAQTMYNQTVTVLPKEVFLGDEMEIRYSFSTNVELIGNEDGVIKIEAPVMDSATIKNIELVGHNGNYILSVQCVPWIVGMLDIPPIDIAPFTSTISVPFILDIPPVTIETIVEKTQKKDLRPVRPPIVIPGTTWILYGLIFLGILLVILLIVILIRIKNVKAGLSSFFERIFSSRNYRRTIKKIKKLSRTAKKISDSDFAKEASFIIRKYFSIRFVHNFEAET